MTDYQKQRREGYIDLAKLVVGLLVLTMVPDALFYFLIGLASGYLIGKVL